MQNLPCLLCSVWKTSVYKRSLRDIDFREDRSIFKVFLLFHLMDEELRV